MKNKTFKAEITFRFRGDKPIFIILADRSAATKDRKFVLVISILWITDNFGYHFSKLRMKFQAPLMHF